MSIESVIRASTERFSITDGRKVVVEIGMGEDPFLFIGRRNIARGITYTGIDNKSGGMAQYEDPFPGAERELKRIIGLDFELREGNGSSTHLPDHSVDLVHYSNVFGDGRRAKNITLLREAARILRQRGTLRVVENLTPYFHPISELRSLAMAVGFFQTNRGKENDPFVLRRFIDPTNRYIDPEFYVADFKPVRH